VRKTFVGDDVEELPLLVDEYSLDFAETGFVDVPNWLDCGGYAVADAVFSHQVVP
jgi:hypothetical protein